MPPIRTMRRAIAGALNSQPVALSPCLISVPVQDGLPFLLNNSGVDDDNRILVFGTERSLELLGLYRHWFCDGTFKIVPELFYQLFTIHLLVNDKTVPCLFVRLRHLSLTKITASQVK